MKEQDLKSLKVDQGRLMDTLHYTCGFGTGTRWGRQDKSYSPKDKLVPRSHTSRTQSHLIHDRYSS